MFSLVALGLGLGSSAGAAPTTGAVEVEVAIPATVEAPSSQMPGFIEVPIPNPITPLAPYDPRPEMFVFLEGGPVAAADREPQKKVVWRLGSHSFSPVLLPVVDGTPVEISNQGRETHLLAAPATPGVIPADPIGPGSSREFPAKGAGVAIRIVSPGSPHVEARVVPVATRYFARAGKDGVFRIDNVPFGDWKVRVWYRDGWLAKTATVTAGPKTQRVKVDLPEQLQPQAPAPAPTPAPAPAPAPAPKPGK